MSARVIQVIETAERRGLGIRPDDPVRRIGQYYDFDGQLLWEVPDEYRQRPTRQQIEASAEYAGVVKDCAMATAADALHVWPPSEADYAKARERVDRFVRFVRGEVAV